MSEKQRHRLTLDLRAEDRELVEELAKANNLSLTDTIRKALKRERWLTSVIKRGDTICLRDCRGKMTEVVFE